MTRSGESPPDARVGPQGIYLIVLGSIVLISVAAVLILAINDRGGEAGAIVGAIGSAAVGALAALSRNP